MGLQDETTSSKLRIRQPRGWQHALFPFCFSSIFVCIPKTLRIISKIRAFQQAQIQSPPRREGARHRTGEKSRPVEPQFSCRREIILVPSRNNSRAVEKRFSCRREMIPVPSRIRSRVDFRPVPTHARALLPEVRGANRDASLPSPPNPAARFPDPAPSGQIK